MAGAGTTGSADIAVFGKASCVFDSATTAGHYVLNDTSTAGDCMDSGAATYPTSGQVIGIVTSTNGGAGTYEVDLSLGQPQAGGTGGGGGASVIAFGSIPGTCTDGTSFYLSDSLYTIVCNPVNTFNYFFHGSYLVTPPPSAGWSWDNQESATISSTHGYEAFYSPRSNNAHLSIRYQTAPLAAYNVKAGFLWNEVAIPPGPSTGANRDVNFGLFFRDGTGKIISYTWGIENSSFQATDWTWTNSTTRLGGSAHAGSSASGQPVLLALGSKSPLWIAIADDLTTNLTFYWSIDRQNWMLFDTWARTDFFGSGPTEIGFGAYTGDGPTWLSLIDWTVGAGASP